MRPLEIAREALKTVWSNKGLWLFGLFLGAGSTGGRAGGSTPAAGNAAGAASSLPGWFWPLLAVAVILALAGAFMHVVSEGALIGAVRRTQDGERPGVGQGFRLGLASFGRVLRVKLLVALLVVGAGLFIALPSALAAFGLASWKLAAGLSAPLVLLGVPALLTLYFVYVYALRIAVLDDKPALTALREARRFLHGRVLESIKLFVMTLLGQLGAGVAALVVVLPAAALGGVTYLLTRALVPALVVGGAVGLPLLLAVAGAAGAFRSSVWTLGFLESRRAQGG